MRTARALPLCALLVLAVPPDEGQWLPSQIRAMDWNALRERGMELTRDEFWHPERGGLLNAAVQIGENDRGTCSAAFVSAEGLILTNHHCCDDAIGRLSSLKQNYLHEGFVARSRVQEQPTGMQIHVVQRIENVTDRIHAAQARAENARERYERTQAEIHAIVTEGERDPATGERDPAIHCHVASLFEGREYHLYYRTRIPDVRLVYAPPQPTAEFGGNVDNWEWPRHSGDFVFLRAYVAPDGAPREYSPDNVPYEPEHFLRVSTEGIDTGDLVLILGYPGRTARYLSSVAVQEYVGFRYPQRRALILELLDVLEGAAEEDPERALQLSATINSLRNIEKNHLGMVQGLARNAVVDRKIREEEGFSAWARESSHREYTEVLNALLDLDHEQRRTQAKDLVLGMFDYSRLRELLPLLDSMIAMVENAGESEDGAPIEHDPDVLAVVGAHDATRDLQRIQKPMLCVLFDAARNLPLDQTLTGSDVLPGSAVVGEELLDDILAKTEMLAPERRVALLKAGRRAIDESDDPLVVLVRGLCKDLKAYRMRQHTMEGRRLEIGPRWIEAQQAWRGENFYPDANSTLRVSIGEVIGYSPRDAVEFEPFTTVEGMLEKHTDEDPFNMPTTLREAAKRRWLSQFRHKRLGDVPVCFLANGDTTNGNSGSPVINGRGELVGLNFDRVFENVAGDFGWNADRSRNISLDVRFVLWHLESVEPAPWLFRELTR